MIKKIIGASLFISLSVLGIQAQASNSVELNCSPNNVTNRVPMRVAVIPTNEVINIKEICAKFNRRGYNYVPDSIKKSPQRTVYEWTGSSWRIVKTEYLPGILFFDPASTWAYVSQSRN